LGKGGFGEVYQVKKQKIVFFNIEFCVEPKCLSHSIVREHQFWHVGRSQAGKRQQSASSIEKRMEIIL
jgi:hypothetical protein